ncbi:hypothetical protein, partial [Pseudomonas sp. BF-R-21]|uniref:hypothetical protein n=1 Tax=Pseudomonas sp. BF-R-21 TaxID=2832387 RepID=UPI001CBC7519
RYRSSRASPLPQEDAFQCGSGLAREGVISISTAFQVDGRATARPNPVPKTLKGWNNARHFVER